MFIDPRNWKDTFLTSSHVKLVLVHVLWTPFGIHSTRLINTISDELKNSQTFFIDARKRLARSISKNKQFQTSYAGMFATRRLDSLYWEAAITQHAKRHCSSIPEYLWSSHTPEDYLRSQLSMKRLKQIKQKIESRAISSRKKNINKYLCFIKTAGGRFLAAIKHDVFVWKNMSLAEFFLSCGICFV